MGLLRPAAVLRPRQPRGRHARSRSAAKPSVRGRTGRLALVARECQREPGQHLDAPPRLPLARRIAEPRNSRIRTATHAPHRPLSARLPSGDHGGEAPDFPAITGLRVRISAQPWRSAAPTGTLSAAPAQRRDGRTTNHRTDVQSGRLVCELSPTRLLESCDRIVSVAGLLCPLSAHGSRTSTSPARYADCF